MGALQNKINAMWRIGNKNPDFQSI